MANPTFKRIKDLSLEKTSVADNDWFVLEDSEDSFKTKKVKGQYIGANIYKNDGTLTGNRTVTMSGNSIAWKGGVFSVGDDANPNARLQGVTNTAGMVALRGYHYGSGGEAIAGLADGANAIAVKGTATGFGASAGKFTGYYAVELNGRVIDTGNFDSTTIAGEVAFLATINSGRWYAVDQGDGTSIIKKKN